MLMVPVAHFWTSASGRDTVTPCEDFTVTVPANSLPSTLTLRSAENPLKSDGQRAVFSNARRNSSRTSGSSWASAGYASLLYVMVIDGLLESGVAGAASSSSIAPFYYRDPAAGRPVLWPPKVSAGIQRKS